MTPSPAPPQASRPCDFLILAVVLDVVVSLTTLSLAFLIGTRPLGCGGGGCRGDRGDLRLPVGRDQDAASGPRPA